MRRSLLRLLFLFGGLSIGVSSLLPITDYVWNDGDIITDGTVIWADSTSPPTIENSLTIQGEITIRGDVTIANTLGSAGDLQSFPVYVDANSFLHSDSGSNYSHLILYADECSRIFFQIDNDLIFTGSNYDDSHADNRELMLTFSGQGQTMFHLSSGKQVGFEGFFGDGEDNGWSSYYDDYTKTGSGVMAYITMDQTYEQAIKNGYNKVVFERFYTYDAGAEASGSVTSTRDSVKVSVGKNSFITYLSQGADGLFDCSGTQTGYGSLAFDPSCYGRGRMLLHLKGSYTCDSLGNITGISNGYNDGAIVVSGHYVADYTTAAGIRTGVQLNQPAGVEAIFRIIDEQAWANTTYYKDSGEDLTYASGFGEPILNGGAYSGQPSRSGLLVLNENKSIPPFAADPFKNNEWYNEYYYATKNLGSTPIRPGFILGVNGSMELFHNTFLDYVSGSTMMTKPFALDQYGGTVSTTAMKMHNPSALMVDGLKAIDISNYDPDDPDNYEKGLYSFLADSASYGGRHAQVLLRGDSRLYFRSGAWSNGYIDKGDLDGAGGVGGYLIVTDRLYSFTINSDASTDGTYDGSFLAGLADESHLKYETIGEGNNILDVEGKLSIYSTQDLNQTNQLGFITNKLNREVVPAGCMSRHMTTSQLARGMLNVPPLKLDHRGQEIYDDLLRRVQRPLTVDQFYPSYNSSSIFLNAEMALHNVEWHHNDLLKIASPEQDKSEPAVVGGELAVFDNAYWTSANSSELTGTANALYVSNPVENIKRGVPLISLYNSTLHVHESIVASGVRFVVTDNFVYGTQDPYGYVTLEDNTSVFKCYNHGDPLDMLKRGYGRTILLGTQQNKMADGIDLSEYTQNSYINIYRGWNTNGNATTWGDGDYRVRLSLETDIQPRYVAQYEDRTESNLHSSLINKYKRTATQVFYLGNNSYSSLGWTTTMGDQVISVADIDGRIFAADGTYSYSYGINEGRRPRPWETAWSLGSQAALDGSTLSFADFKFSLTAKANDFAEMYVNGDNYYFGGRDASGNLATEPVVASNESGIFYANHGGRFHINQNDLSLDQQHYYDCFVDTIFAYRQWPRVLDADTNTYMDALSGVVDLPHDQVKFGRSIQPYQLNFQTMLSDDGRTKENNVRLRVYDGERYGTGPSLRKKASGEEVSIGWNFRTDKSVRIGIMDSTPTFTPVKSLIPASDIFNSRSTRISEDVGPVTMPDVLLTVSTGDIITQLRVAGATKADPFHLYVTGGHAGHGIVRELTSLDSTYFTPGEGCHGAIFIDGGGHLGIGDRDWNEHSRDAWSILGFDYLTLYPNGNGFVWLNSDIIVSDRLALIPTKNFGAVSTSGDQVLTFTKTAQRLTFHSVEPREIRIPEGGELDLSAFGNPVGTTPEGVTYPQQIEFSGRTRLVFEPGSILRFPSSATVEPVLYFNDESELVFEGREDRDEQVWTDYTGSDEVRSKILGIGQIWLNKNAKMKINDTALVGVETDDDTVTTSLTISIQRQAKMLIGDANVSGGGFQVGNPEDRAGVIDFTLALDGAYAELEIEREGFVGFGVGTINKSGEPNRNWRLLGLYDVNSIIINLTDGIINHNQIFDGSDRKTSLMAIGPVGSGGYVVNLGARPDAIIRGGGNLIYVDAAGDIYPNTGGIDGSGKPPHSTDLILSTATPAGGTTGNYNLMASTALVRQLSSVANGTPVAIVKNTSFAGDAQAFFNYIGYLPIDTPYPDGSFVCFARSANELISGHVLGTTIFRTPNITINDSSNPEDSLNLGALTASIDADGTVSMLTRSY